MTKTACLAFGYWSQNIGNAFFQIGGEALLKSVLGNDNVFKVHDIPNHWTLHRKSKGNADGWFDMISRIEADYVVFQGPSLDAYFELGYSGVLGRLAERGIEPVLLGIGFLNYTAEEVQQAKRLIEDTRIRTVSTRDRNTFQLLQQCASYDGIDSAFFLPWAYQPVKLQTDGLIALNYERMSEPVGLIKQLLHGESASLEQAGASSGKWNRLLKRSHALSYAATTLRPGRGRRLERIGRWEVARTVHRSNPANQKIFFQRSNSVVSDEPYTYCNLYANAEYTFSDRVHACVASLAYDRSAFFGFETKRASLLERVGLELPMTTPQRLDPSYLEQERSALREHLVHQLTK